MASWTLEYGGTEKSLDDWGLGADLTLSRLNQGVDTCTVSHVGASMDEAPAFAYRAGVIFRRDRVWNQGSSTWSDGTVWFRGKAVNPQRFGSGSAEGVQYIFVGPWWDLERLVFQQTWKVYQGDPDNLANAYTSEVFLGQSVLSARQTNGQTVTEVLNWAITCGVNLQIGTIEASAMIPIYNARDMTCAEVILQMLRWTNDVAWFDYSTSPPTFHARSVDNLTAASVAVSDRVIESLRLAPRYDLLIPAVCIRFKRVNEVDGTSWVEIVNQFFARDGGGTPITPTGLELGASVHTVELFGVRAVTSSVTLKCSPILARSSTEADRIDWWKKKVTWLNSPSIDQSSIHISVAAIDDKQGNSVDGALATYPNELTDGQIPEWIAKDTADLTIKALVTYDRFTASGKVIKSHTPLDAPVHVKVKATNAVSGSYSTLTSFEEAEAIPVGLAQQIYDARRTLQYEGDVSLVAEEIPIGLGMGYKLTVTGTALTLSGLMVQAVDEEPFTGRMNLTVGPPSQLGLSDLIELLRVNRYRLTYSVPAARTTGKANGNSGNVELAENLPKENSTSDTTPSAFNSTWKITGENTDIIRSDAVNNVFEICQLDSITGGVVGSAGRIEIKRDDANGKFLYIREVPICIGGVQKHMMCLCSQPY